MKIDPSITTALEQTGRPYEITSGGRHLKILLAGRLVGVLPTGGGGRESDRRSTKNIISQIRRAASGQPSNRRAACV